jgi:diaminopimelate epimerase
MCGNGVRAFAKYVYEHGLTDKTELAVETAAGIIRPSLTVEEGKVVSARVDMGEPRLKRAEIPMAGQPEDQPVVGEVLNVQGQEVTVTCVSMGNPHCVVFVDDVDSAPVETLGPAIENHEAFPRRTNVEFAAVHDRQNIAMRVWERGAGETLACGTGASATAVAAALNGSADRTVRVMLLGGDLHIEWADNNHVFLTGPAAEAFSGEVSPDLLEAARR